MVGGMYEYSAPSLEVRASDIATEIFRWNYNEGLDRPAKLESWERAKKQGEI